MANQDGRGTFVLGLGAQKAGTTWLSDYLRDSPAFDPGFSKEYHVLDVLAPALEEWMRRRVLRLGAEAVAAVASGARADADHLHRAAMVADPGRYYDYFTGLLDRDDAVRATGDLTPSHAMLPTSRLRELRTEFRAREVRVVAVFLMRDPVERLWSAARMHLESMHQHTARAAEERVLAQFERPAYALRTGYDKTLARIDAVFAEDEVHVGFYEQLFTDESTRAICELVGLDHHPGAYARRSNVTARPSTTLPEELAATVARRYAPAYEAVAARRPDLDLTELWPSARYVLG